MFKGKFDGRRTAPRHKLIWAMLRWANNK